MYNKLYSELIHMLDFLKNYNACISLFNNMFSTPTCSITES